MPKVKITETDNTGSPTLNPITNVVFIPGKAGTKMEEPVLLSSSNELSKAIAEHGLVDDLSLKLAKRLIQLGMQVLYQGFAENEEGGITISSDDWALLSDKALYDIRFLTTGGYALPSQEMVNCASKRGDCVALIDHASTLKDVASIREAIGALTKAKDAKTGAYLSKYAAAFTPWFKSNVEDFGDELIPPSFGYLFAYARSIQSNPTWYAVAGTFRGNIPELKEVAKKYSTAEIEMLQGRAENAEVELGTGDTPFEPGDNVGFAINPIAYVRGYGYLVWGNRTLNVNEINSSTKAGILKATSFLNVRNLCSDIVKTLYAAARRYTFEQNSNTLWLNFKYQIQPLLDRMVSGNGIGAYTFEQLPTEAKARLRARITITPIEGVEDFELELCLEDSLEVIE